MKVQTRIRTAVLVTSLIAGLSTQAAVLIVSDGVTSSGPITLSGGVATYSTGSFDSSWGAVTVAAESKPLIGSASSPDLEVDVQAISLGSTNPLMVILSDNGFGPTSGNNNVVAQLVGQPLAGTGDDVTFNTYYDTGNTLDALTTLLTGSGSVLPNAGNEYDNSLTNSLSLVGPYSLTAVMSIDGVQATTYSLLANLQATNQVCDCSLSFSSVPTNLTVCGSSAIPSPLTEASLITATDTCIGSVPVKFLGATTNVVCPTNGFCFITNGYCFHTNGSCFPTNFISCPTSGICFLTNGICCPVVGNCSLSSCNGNQNCGNCFQSLANCFQNFGNCNQNFNSCFQNLGNCFQNFGCNQNLGDCFQNCGACVQYCGRNCTANMGMCCPMVITLTFGATNGCGVLVTTTQTVTVQCQPFFKVTCSQPPQFCCGQQQNCFPQQQNCYNQPPQICFPQQQNCFGQQQNCFGQQQNCFGQQQNCFGGAQTYGGSGLNCFGQ